MTATKAQQPSSSPFSRLSRLGIGLGFRSQPSPTYTPKLPRHRQEEEDWYIAYNGPYEVPADTRKRDSWGDVIEGEERDQDTVLNDTEFIRRYGGRNDKRRSLGIGSSDGSEYRRGRAQSTSSGLTASSGTMDPSRKSIRVRSPYTSRRPHTASTYINLDAAGGIGESPIPRQRSSPITPASVPASATKANRTSLASYFFGGQPTFGSEKKSLRSNQNLAQATSPKVQPGQNVQKEQPRVLSIDTSTNNDDYYNSYYSTLINTPKHLQGLHHVPRPSQATISTKPDPPAEPAEADIDDIQRHHPYAYNFPTTAALPSVPAPQPADTPIVTRSATSPLLRATHVHQTKDSLSSGSHSHQDHPRRPVVSVKTPSSNHHTAGDTLPASTALKSSVSTPNLRDAQRPSLSSRMPTGVDRWLSAETWCDAVFLPRPRFRMNQGNGSGLLDTKGSEKSKGSGRIVSPPPTPIARSPPGPEVNEKFAFPKGKEVAPPPPAPLSSDVLASLKPRRKLTKSKSAGSLRSTKDSAAPTSDVSVPGLSMFVDTALLQGNRSKGKGTGPAKLQKNRPKDTVLCVEYPALKSEPDLDCVLNEGDELEARRKKWQAQAANSFGNKKSRSVGRGRAKSLNYKEGRGPYKDKDGKPMGSIDFLAARTLLGSQIVIPAINVVVREPGSPTSKSEIHTTAHSGTLTGTISSKSHSHTTSRTTGSHAHTNSLAHSSSQQSSSQSHNRHSRSDSWGQSALKLAKYTSNGADQTGYISVDEKHVALEGAIRSNGTKFVRLANQPDIQEEEDTMVIAPQTQGSKPPDPTTQNGANLAVGSGKPIGASPTPSGGTGTGVGIALSTPPPSDNHSRVTYDISDHPYAHGAVFPYHDRNPSVDFKRITSAKVSSYAGPHPSTSKVAPIPLNLDDMSVRHRLPPQMTLHHPYAMGSRREEEQFGVQDQGPVDQLQSCRRDGDADAGPSRMVHAYARQSTGNLETLGVGEALSWRRGDTKLDDREYALSHPQIPLPASTQKVDDTRRHSTRRDSRSSQTWPPRRKPVSYAEDVEPSSISPYSPVFLRNASDSTKSSGSSPEHSPRPLGNVDDLDRFHDLFYNPERPNADVTPPIESRIGTRSGGSKDSFPWDVGSSRSVRSGLSSLTRKLTEEYEDQRSLEHMPDINSHTLKNGQVLGKPRARPAHIDTGHEIIFSDPSKSLMVSPGPMETPLTLQFGHEQPDDNVPEDVHSSRASSILEPGSVEDDTIHSPLRFGAIAAITTPLAVTDDRIHTPLVADQVVHQGPVECKVTEAVPQSDEPHRITSQMSVVPLSATGDLTRSSYVTSTTEGSRMSGLSDFPTPPVQNLTPAHMSIIHSYFGRSTPPNQVEDLLSSNEATHSEPGRNANFRMTFGGSEDMEVITPGSPRSPHSPDQ